MKFTLTIEGVVEAELSTLLRRLNGGENEPARQASVTIAKPELVKDQTDAPPAPPAKRGPGRPKKEEKAEEPARYAPKAEVDADDNGNEDTAPEAPTAVADVDDETFLVAVRKFASDAKVGGVPATQAILAQFTAEDGKPVQRVNQVQKSDRAAVMLKIKEAADKKSK